MEKLRKSANRFLWGSLSFVMCLSVLTFLVMAAHMRRVNRETLDEVATVYMSSASEQVSLHFETVVNTQLEHMRMAARTIGSDVHDNDEAKERLSRYMSALGFVGTGFLREDGTYDAFYGDGMSVIDQGPFVGSLLNGECKIAVGLDDGGNKVLLMGIPAEHGRNGERCVGLVSVMPVSYVGESLPLEESRDGTYSFIIRKDGSFVVRSAGAFRENYFERAKAQYEPTGGVSVDEYCDTVREAMAGGGTFSMPVTIGGERRHVFGQALSFSEWYLLTFMPYDILDDAMSGLNRDWSACVAIAAGILISSLVAVFVIYFRMTRRQLEFLEQARAEAERATKAKSEFLSSMSHDIRTPMNAIVGMTAIATANLDDREKVQGCLKKITMSSKHLLGLINDVLDMSKIESGKMTLGVDRVSLRELVEGLVGIIQPQVNIKRQEFSVSVRDVSCEDVYCDGVRLNQVLLNILSNAVKFTPDGGSITLSLRESGSPKGDGYVRVEVSVRDTGIGMTPEFVEHIFESFVREDSARVRKTQGAGLGMAITKHIVDAMEGQILVDSAIGKGSTFTVVLDLERAEESESEMVLPPWRVLVVDDDVDVCESACDALESIGMTTDWVQDGETAVEQVMSHAGGASSYRVILMDWRLPGIDGIETARRIHASLQATGLDDDIPILLISAYDCSEIEDEARAAGVDGFIPKPLFRSTLYRSLRGFASGVDEECDEVVSKPGPLAGRRVLVAEDNELNWEVASELLSMELGLECEWARDGRECVDMFAASPVGHYDAVLMDIRMPNMDGHEAAKVIRAMDRVDKGLPIIAMTADAFAEDERKALEAGMDAHVAKPVDVDEVSRILSRLLEKRKGD